MRLSREAKKRIRDAAKQQWLEECRALANAPSADIPAVQAQGRRGSRLSPESKQRIADSAARRWAKKSSGPASAPEVEPANIPAAQAPRARRAPEARSQIAQAAKQRWAAVRAQRQQQSEKKSSVPASTSQGTPANVSAAQAQGERRPGISAEGMRKIKEDAEKRWAATRAQQQSEKKGSGAAVEQEAQSDEPKIPSDFLFSKIPAVQTEGERRAVLMFGKKWQRDCHLSHAGKHTAIALGSKMLAYGDGKSASFLEASETGKSYDLADGSAALLTFYPSGIVKVETRYRNGRRNDAVDGTPARVEYSKDGKKFSICHFRDGSKNDTADGTPAEHEFFPSGKIERTHRYQNGVSNDAADGSHAVVRYFESGVIARTGHLRRRVRTDGADGSPAVVNYYPNGNLKQVEYICCRRTLPKDPANGSPACVYYSEDGAVTGGYSSEKKRELTDKEAYDMIMAPTVARVAALLAKADQSVIPIGLPLPKA